MRWARDARNSIEKKGDLETHSQVRAEIIASYTKGPETKWMPDSLFASPRAIWESIPRRFFIPHVMENGTLLIERRWVDSELPDMEVLEALAHVYDDFCSTIIDLFGAQEIRVPSQLDQSRPDAMGELAMDRAIYLSMQDGSLRGMRYFKKPLQKPSPRIERRLIRRYGNVGWNRLKEATTLRAVAEVFFDNARAVMKRDGFHHNMTFLMKGPFPIEMIKTDHPDRATRYVLMRDLARLAHIADADGVIVIAEAWMASHDNVPKSGFAVDATDRKESITLSGANAQGERFQLIAMVERRRLGSKKVKRLGPTEVDAEGFPFIFLPFFEEWGCVDEVKLARSLESLEELGIETPSMPALLP
jgi:hypothetical protein